MQTHGAARSAAGLLSLIGVVALSALPPAAAAAPGNGVSIGRALLRSASWHGRDIERPLPASRGTSAAPPISRLRGWSAGPVRLGVGFARAAGSRRVREVQRLLRLIGYRPGPVDGRFGPRTEAAVIDFQYKHGLSRNGVVGTTTLPMLKARARAHWPAGWIAGPVHRGSGYGRAGGSVRVREVQRRLATLGIDTGPVDGLFGPLTERAVKRFQARHRLRPDGVVGLRTLAALGLLVRKQPARPATPAGRRITGRSPTPARGVLQEPARLPLGLIFACLALIGLMTGVASYVRTRARVRSSQRRVLGDPTHAGRNRPEPVRRPPARQAIGARSNDDH